MQHRVGLWLVLGLGLMACNSSGNSSAGVLSTVTAGMFTPAAASGSGGAPGAAGVPASAGGGAAAPDTGDVPCAVAAVLKQHCVRCHGKVLREGAPVSLVDSASFQRDAGGQREGAAVLARVRSNERPMPPPPAARLTEPEIATLEAWIAPGAAPTHPGCSVDDSPAGAAAGSGGSGVTVVNTAGSTAPPVAGGAAPPTGELADWGSYGVDLANSRNNAGEKTLSIDNVKGLKKLWTFMGPSTTSTPAVVDGVVYLPGWDGKVYALDLDDGKQVWTTTLPDLIDSSPAVTATQVFVSDDNGGVHALERTTGKLQWSQAVDAHVETHLWSSPVYIPDAGLVVVGVASGEEQVAGMVAPTFRGSVVALEAATGKQRWKFETASAASGSGPGIAVWGTAAVDTKRKAVYIGTGNNYAAPAGEYADSMLAISYETGKLLWFKQFTPNDIFTIYAPMGPDFDIGSSANLFSVDGKDYLGIGVKNGTFYALERDTGMTKWMTMITAGSSLGGVISASAYANGMLFAASHEMMSGPTATVALDAKDGHIVWRHSSPKLTYGGLAHANGIVFLGTTAGSIFALDGAKGTMLWVDQTPNNQPIAGSPSVSRGKLLVPWGYSWTLREGAAGSGGLTVYGL